MATGDYRRASYEIWQAMAAGWDRERGWTWEVSRPVSENLLEALAPEPDASTAPSSLPGLIRSATFPPWILARHPHRRHLHGPSHR